MFFGLSGQHFSVFVTISGYLSRPFWGFYNFELRRFDGPEYYADEAEDSQAEVAKRGKKVFLGRTISLRSVSRLSGVELDDNRIFWLFGSKTQSSLFGCNS